MRRSERSWLPLAPALGLVQVVVGLVAPPAGPGSGWSAVGRLILAAGCSLTLVFGPGLALRGFLLDRGRGFPLAAVILPGPAVMAIAGGLAWWGASVCSPHVTLAVLLTPVMAGLLVLAHRHPALDPASAPWGRRAMVVVVVVLAIAVAKGTWSPGPTGELYGGTVSRTLEVGGRSDSRISFHIVQLVAHGTSPYSERGRNYFAPYSFSHRGPIAGVAASPVVLLAGAKVPLSMPDQPWSPFDREGFAAYRLAMSTMAVASLLALFALASRLLGFRTGYHALLLGALTPFIVHETYFVWPKLQAGGLVLVAAYLVVERRPGWAGLVLGLAYLVHPMALLSLPMLALVWLLVSCRDGVGAARIRRGLPSLAGLARMGAGALACLLAWRLANGHEFKQLSFVQDNLLRSDAGAVTGIGEWLAGRISSVLNTLVPLHLVVRDSAHSGVNSIYGRSPGIVVFYFQYWTSLPFGLAIVALPVLVARLRQAARLVPEVMLAVVVVPFVVFAVFWGGDSTGMLREGMHVWVLAIVVMVAWGQARGGPLPSRLAGCARSCLALRGPETLLMLLLPATVTSHALYHRQFLVTDVAALAVMVGGLGWLTWVTWVTWRGDGATAPRTTPTGRHPAVAGSGGRPTQ